MHIDAGFLKFHQAHERNEHPPVSQAGHLALPVFAEPPEGFVFSAPCHAQMDKNKAVVIYINELLRKQTICVYI